MSSSEVSDASLNDIGSDGEMSTYSSGSELNMDLLTRADNGTVFDPSHKKIKEVQKLIAFCSFPSNEENIRLYSCLSVGGSHSFNDGVALFAKDAVRDCVQIGFFLSASVLAEAPIQSASSDFTPIHRVSLMFDRTCITSCSCTCTVEVEGISQQQQSLNQRNDLQNDSYLHTTSVSLPKQQVVDSGVWCAHVVATCLKRIRSPGSVIYRPPISESLSKLNKNELQLFAQQLICHVGARKILPAAQSILDDILMPHTSPVKGFVEGQDPTAGGLIGESSSWRFNISTLEEKLRNTLVRFSKTKSPFHGDLSSINSCLSHHFEEMICILRSLRTYEPRGVWALLAVIIGMLRKKDLNALPILQMFTRCILDVDEIMFWWYVVQLNVDMQVRPSQVGKRKQSCYGAAWLCEALVDVWRLVCLDPKLREKGSPRKRFISKLSNWHQAAIIKAQRGMRVAQFFTSAGSTLLFGSAENLGSLFSENNQKLFVGFKPAIQACQYAPTSTLPHFDGAFVADYSTGVEMWNRSFEAQETTGCQSYPSMRGQFGINFARCQGLVMHDDTGASLAWARHLALEMLLSAPSVVAAAKSASLQNLETASQIDPLIESLKHTERMTCLNSSTSSARRYRRTVTTTTINTSVGTSSVMTTAATPRRGGGGGSNLRRTASNIAPQRSSELEQLAKLWSDFYVSEVAEFSITFTEWVYCVEYLMDCLYSFHYNEGLVYPPSLSNQHLTHPSIQGGDSSVGVYHSPSFTTSSPSGAGASFGTTPDSAAEWFSLDMELGFRLGLLTLALPRPQHTVAAMEVRLFDHEASLLSRLYRLPLEFACPWVIESVRREAQLLGDGVNRFGDCSAAYVPYSLSEFLFQMLAGSDPLPPSNTLPPPPLPPPISGTEDGGEGENSSGRSAYAVSDNATAGGSNVTPSTTQTPTAVVYLPLALRIQQHGGNFDPDPNASTSLIHETRDDCELAFGLARHIFGQRTRIPEKVAPMFVECQRSQMQSFVLRILRYYKDDSHRISDLIESLLDPSLNSTFKPPPLWFCLSASLEEMMHYRFENEASSVTRNDGSYSDSAFADADVPSTAGGATEPVSLSVLEEVVGIDKQNNNRGDTAIPSPASPPQDTSASFSCVEKNHQASSERAATSTSEDTDTLSDSKAWDKRLRCATLRDPRRINRHSVGMAAVDSSAPETTSSDNSPTTSRGAFRFRLPKGMTPGDTFITSGSGTSVARRRNGGSSSDCLSSSTGEDSRSTAGVSSSNVAVSYSRSMVGDGMRCAIPRQRPTESYAQHIFQLAKSIRTAAGGPNASVSVFNPEAVTHGPTNQNLHFAAVQVGLYALGLVNLQQPSWKSRTYSRHVAWISQQIFEIELPAAFMLLHSWRNHFTTEEVTAVAYQLFKKGDQRLSKMAGELCLASLTDCTTLKSDAIKCALSQLSAMPEMLERGLLCIEEGVKSTPYGVMSELHFQLANYWFRLYEITKGKLPTRPSSVEVTSGTPVVSTVENQPSNNESGAWPGSFQESVHPSIPELVYIPTTNIDPIAAAVTAAGSAFVPSFAQPFSLPFYPVFPVQSSQQVSVSLPPMQQLTMQPVAPAVYDFYSGHSHLYPTATPASIPQVTASIAQDDIEDYLRRAMFAEDAVTSGSPVIASAAADAANTGNARGPPLGPENEAAGHDVAETRVETPAVVEPPIDSIAVKSVEGAVIWELEGKARHFLLRSFRSFLSGIEKLFLSQTPQLGSTPLQSRDWSGKFCHWQHRHQHLDGENVSTLFQNESLSSRVSLADTRGNDYAPGSSEENILRALEVAEMLGDEAVSIYCRRMIKCIPCPLIMSAITVKVLDKYFPNRLSSSTSSSSSVYSQCSPSSGYPFSSSVGPYQLTHQRPLVWSYSQWEPKYMLQKQQQTITVPAVVGDVANDVAPNTVNKELLEQMVNRIHYLFHVQVNLHLRSIDRSEECWGEFVDMVLSAYLANQRMPPTNQTLTWECLFRRIEQYSRNMPALLERVVACIETINMRFPPPSITAAFAAATGFNGVHLAISIPSSGAPPPPPPHSSS
ncbi:unnamed protein product [Hydatigera taeniaeformis]|uniref:Rab-GAP TBC domain-containing protein n=1 Tax=Hydatigena taeniaeformis TaxID=6205 RepID=A0A0R3WZE0_HYDTA|nr:unnamed protein product [Hydatigera taeniaeformis]